MQPPGCSMNCDRKVKRKGLTDAAQLKGALQEALIDLLEPLAQPLDTNTHKPFIIMLTGVNGAGKTTSIGKLAHHFQLQGKTVLLAAGDTFRAAAREQLDGMGGAQPCRRHCSRENCASKKAIPRR